MNVIDQINGVSADDAVSAAFGILDTLQGLNPPGLRVPAVAIMYLMICDRFNINPTDLLSKSERILHDSLMNGKGEHVRAIRDYLENEM